MGMVAAAIAVPPIGMGLATLIRRKLFSQQERESGIAALFMGFFGITEGAIPLAAARPLQVIPANVIGGAVAGAIAAVWGVEDNVMHGGPIVGVLGAVENVLGLFMAVIVGAVVTALLAMVLLQLSSNRTEKNIVVNATDDLAGTGGFSADGAQDPGSAGAAVAVGTTSAGATAVAADSSASAGVSQAGAAAQVREKKVSVLDYISDEAILLDVDGDDRDTVVRRLAERGAATGAITDVDAVVTAAFEREAKGTTGVGQGIAIPHAKSDGVDRPVVAFARSKNGVDWSAMDGEPVNLMFLIAVPEVAADNEHLKILASLSRALTKTDFRENLMNSSTGEEVLSHLRAKLG